MFSFYPSGTWRGLSKQSPPPFPCVRRVWRVTGHIQISMVCFRPPGRIPHPAFYFSFSICFAH